MIRGEFVTVECTQGKKLGWFPKEKFEGEFFSDWNKAIDEAGFDKIDAGPMVASVLAVKEENEINTIKKACEITNKIFSKYLKDQIINIIDNEKVGAFTHRPDSIIIKLGAWV